MDSIRRDFLEQRLEEEKKQLSMNSALIENFKRFCVNAGVKLVDDNIKYVETIGIVVSYPDILSFICPLKKDKEGLIPSKSFEGLFPKKPFACGYFYGDNYMIMAHPFFRRSFNENANFTPRFIELFWGENDPRIETYISIDFNRIRINVDESMYMELDTWFGASFNRFIGDISDGIVKLRPPLDIDNFTNSFFFNDAYSLDIKWSTDKNIKIFQAEEFKLESLTVPIANKTYYPVRYLHAEFDLSSGVFRHFDGAIHLYTEEEYYIRRDSDFNYNTKNREQIKTLSTKLFKMNGKLSVGKWIQYTSHFFSGNPLVFEYFEGDYPERILKAIGRK